MNAKRFLLTWVATALAAVLVVAAFNIVADPYLFFGTPGLPGLTVLKPRMYQQVQMAKTYQLERIKPRTLLLGNSRVEIGLDPESLKWPEGYKPIFNAAFAGRNLFTAVYMLREALAVSVLKTIVVGLDFQDFDESQTPPNMVVPIFDDERRLLVDRREKPNPDRAMQIWRDRGSATLTMDAFYDSAATLLDQHPATTVTMTPFGFNPLNEYRVFVARSGYYQLFAQRNAGNEAIYKNRPRPDFANIRQFEDFRYLEQILDIAREHNVLVVLFIHPYHSDYLEMFHRMGLWESFENWKRALVRVTEARHSPTVRLYDFADYNELTTEHVPPRGDTQSEMHWYWEAGHYKSALGDELLATMFGSGRLGHQLTAATIEPVLAEIRRHRERFLAGAQQHSE
jgi:hypothetical protein